MFLITRCKVRTATTRRVVQRAKKLILAKVQSSRKEGAPSACQSTTESTLILAEKFTPTTLQKRKSSSARLIRAVVLKTPLTEVARPKPRHRRLSTKLRLSRETR